MNHFLCGLPSDLFCGLLSDPPTLQDFNFCREEVHTMESPRLGSQVRVTSENNLDDFVDFFVFVALRL